MSKDLQVEDELWNLGSFEKNYTGKSLEQEAAARLLEDAYPRQAGRQSGAKGGGDRDDGTGQRSHSRLGGDRGPSPGTDRGNSAGNEPGTDADNIRSDSQVVSGRTELIDRARSAFERPENLARFRADVETFEERARRDGLRAGEVSRVYRELLRLIEPRQGAVIGQDGREQLAREILHQAAYPYGIDQGRHYTCTVSALESRLYARNPLAAAHTITELSTSSRGEFQTASGRTVRVDAASLIPDSEAANQARPDGERTYASQVMQLAMVNEYWSGQSAQRQGQNRYVQLHNVTEQDSGERLIDGSGHVVDHAPDIRAVDLPAIYREFSHERIAAPFVIVRANRIPTSPDGRDPTGVCTVADAADLGRAVEHLESRGAGPVIVEVDPSREPWSRSGGRYGSTANVEALGESLSEYPAALAIGPSRQPDAPNLPQPAPAPRPINRERNSHVVSIVSSRREDRTGRMTMQVSNTWGDASDISVDLQTLFLSL